MLRLNTARWVAGKSSKSGANSPVLAPGVVRSLYRMLLREVKKLDDSPVSKTLFPLSKDLQDFTKSQGPLYVPNGVKYINVLRQVFRDSKLHVKPNLAFDTLSRLRAHNEKVTSKIPIFMKDHDPLITSMKMSFPDTGLYRAESVSGVLNNGTKYVPVTSSVFSVPTKAVLRSTRSVDLKEGIALVAHPLSSTHVDRRVLLVTEYNPHVTTAIVLDMLFTYPLSRGNPMFPEVFWGHEVYDGGFSQIGFTMPPTAQITILHTLEPPTEPGSSQYLTWLKWKDAKSKTKVETPAEHHRLLCTPIIRGDVTKDGIREPTLYMSKVEALPYLAQLAQGKPRSSLRVYWGSMRWPTHQLEAEVANGHWIPVKLSPNFFAPFSLVQEKKKVDKFPTKEELEGAREMRERRYGVDVSLPQVFPPDQILRRRECLWDQIMYCLGGEFSALVGCVNPFSGTMRGVLPLEVNGPAVMSEDAVDMGDSEEEEEEGEDVVTIQGINKEEISKEEDPLSSDPESRNGDHEGEVKNLSEKTGDKEKPAQEEVKGDKEGE